MPESQNYTHAAFDWPAATGVPDAEVYECSPMGYYLDPMQMETPHHSQDSNYAGGAYVEEIESYADSGLFSEAGGNFVSMGGGGEPSSLWSSGCVPGVPVPLTVQPSATHACEYNGVPISISDTELRRFLNIADDDELWGSTILGH